MIWKEKQIRLISEHLRRYRSRWENTSKQRKRLLFISLGICSLWIITAWNLFGPPPPFQSVQYNWSSNKGERIYEPLQRQFFGEILGIPSGLKTYKLRFEHTASTTCQQPQNPVSLLRLDSKEGDIFIRYAKGAFDYDSCYIGEYQLAQKSFDSETRETYYHFCIPENTVVEFLHPADEPLSFEEVVYGYQECLSGSDYDANSYSGMIATPLWSEWLMGWGGALVIWILIIGGVLSIRDYIIQEQ